MPDRVFSTGSKRDSDDGKPRLDLISTLANYREGMCLALGAEKYGERNWEKGQPIMSIIASLKRHIDAYIEGRDDEDHAGAIRTNAGFLVHTDEAILRNWLPSELDDRPKYGGGELSAEWDRFAADVKAKREAPADVVYTASPHKITEGPVVPMKPFQSWHGVYVIQCEDEAWNVMTDDRRHVYFDSGSLGPDGRTHGYWTTDRHPGEGVYSTEGEARKYLDDAIKAWPAYAASIIRDAHAYDDDEHLGHA